MEIKHARDDEEVGRGQWMQGWRAACSFLPHMLLGWQTAARDTAYDGNTHVAVELYIPYDTITW